MKNRASILNAVLAVALITGLCVTASASAVTWRGWNTHTKGYPNTVALEQFAKTITKKTDGRINAKVYNNAVLGEQIDAIQQVISGALQFGNFNMSPVGQYVPETNILSLPYLFTSIQQQLRVLTDTPVGDKLNKAMADNGLIVLAWFYGGQRSFYNSQHPINTPADLKGMKVRVQKNDLYVATMEALGANPTPLPSGAVYQSLASGVVDAAENNYPTYTENNHYKVAPYYSEDRHFIVPECLCISKKAWNKLSYEDQAIVRKAALKAAQLQQDLWTKTVKKNKEFLKKQGVNINQIEKIELFQDAMKPVYEQFFKKHPDQKKMVELIRNTK